jgi:hypothetical protein
MATIRDAYSPSLWKAADMTDTINLGDRKSTRIRDMGLFTEKRVTTTLIGLEKVRGSIQLVQSSPRGGAGQQRLKDKRAALAIPTVRYSEEATLTADEIRDVWAAGGNFLKNMETARNEKIAEVAGDLDHTEEYVYQGALNGEILDADGSVIYNLYDMMNVAVPDVITFDIAGSVSIKQYAQTVRRAMAEALGQDGEAGFVIRARVGHEFYDHIVNSDETARAYDRWQDGAFLRDGGQAFEEFGYAGVIWEEIQPSTDGKIGVAAEQAKFYPVLPELYKAFYSPSDKLSDLAGAGLPRYSWATVDRKDRSVEVEGQMNLIAIMTKPDALLTGELG